MERIGKIALRLVLGAFVAALMVSTIGYADEQSSSDEAQIPVGSRLSVKFSTEFSNSEVHTTDEDYDCGCIEDGFFDSESDQHDEYIICGHFYPGFHPAYTHQVVETLIGPVGIPLIDGTLNMLEAGFYVRLDDTSIWKIQDADIQSIQDWWRPSDFLRLTVNKSSSATPYRYNLCNLAIPSKVRICPRVGPKLSWTLRHYIYDLNMITGELILDDGSLWQVSSADADLFSEWLPDDSVIIGVNKDWTSYKRPNIIINLTTNDHVRCSWIR